MQRDAQALAEACAAAMWQGDAASQGLGMCLDAVAPGSAVLSMAVAASMVNGHGICHGGFIFTLADSAFAFACNSRNRKTVAQGGSIVFLRPARLGEILRAEAEERALAGRGGLYDIRVTGGDGRVVAELRGQARETGEVFFPGQDGGDG